VHHSVLRTWVRQLQHEQATWPQVLHHFREAGRCLLVVQHV
jgi:transposase-like protein